jgi:putative DNA primase/helicase
VTAGAEGATVPTTPRLFTRFCVEYDFASVYEPPARWLAFLDSSFPGDQESIDTLQEYLGYCLSSDTRQHKMLMMCGPPRSGKGTVDRVFTRVIGASNRVGATLHDLDRNFALSKWLGKQLAVITEARVSGRTDGAAVASRLLAITGEDEITVDIKYKEPWTGRMGTRIIVIANDVPAIVDPSKALVNRFIFLNFTKSFLGREDLGLTERLVAEAPQILNWCILGLGRLRQRGCFIQPESGLILCEQFQGLSSKISEFVDEMCVVAPAQECEKDVLFDVYVKWCKQNNTHAGTKQQFARDLYSAFPGVGDTQKNFDGDRPRYFRGIGLRESPPFKTDATVWLKGFLDHGPCPAMELYSHAHMAGFDDREINYALKVLGVETYRDPETKVEMVLKPRWR